MNAPSRLRNPPSSCRWNHFLLLAALTSAGIGLPAQGEPVPYETWIQQFRGLSVQERAFSADPDGDGIPNGGEQQHGLNPTLSGKTDPNWENAPHIGRERGNVQFEYTIPPKTSGDGSHTPLGSADLQSWHTLRPQVEPGGKHTVTADPRGIPQQFFRLNYNYNPPATFIPHPTFSARSEESLGSYFPSDQIPWELADTNQGEWRATHRQRWTNLRGGFAKIAANFLVEGDQVPVSIMFSAEAYVQPKDKRLFVRLLVDGQPMHPGDVVLANGRSPQIRAARTFEFTGIFDRGLHTVEAQWMADDGSEGYIRDAALLIRQGDTDDTRASLIPVTPDSGQNIETKSATWQDVPGLSATVIAEDRDCITATVSAEAYTAADETLLLRVLIDGVVADPGRVEFASNGFEGTHCMAFGLGDVDPGSYNIQVQYRSHTGKTVGLGDRTLTVATGDAANTSPMRKWFRSASDMVNAPGNWAVLPGMTNFTLLPEDSDLSVIFTAEINKPGSGNTKARLTIGGVPVPGSEIMLTDGDSHTGVHSFSFDAKHVNAGGLASASNIAIEWDTDSPTPMAIEERSMVLYVKDHRAPDLAEPPKLGTSYVIDTPESFAVEPMHGKRHVLVILVVPKLIDDPVPGGVTVPGGLSGNGEPIPSIPSLQQAVFGSSNSVADYYHEVSDGRMELENAGVVGPYETDLDWDFYYNGPGDHQDIWVEAVTKAELDGFKFSDYDFDGDGYLSHLNELAIMVVIPQIGTTGFVRDLWGGETPKKRDGVYIERISIWYTSNPTVDYDIPTHEIGHQVFRLADLYAKSAGGNVGTRPGLYCLMDQARDSGNTGIAQHLNPAYKIPLGWVTPRIVTNDTPNVQLEDMKTGHEVVVLPRIPSVTGDEYVILENRPQPLTNAHYDLGISDSGLGVWHIVESGLDNVNPPPCTSQNLWNTQTSPDNPRRGIRLVRPSVSYSNVNALWDDTKYDLDEFGLTCPPQPAHNVLLWSDGSPSYELRNFSSPGPVMSLNVHAP